MPKKVHKIESFTGGLNSGSDPRDIADSQLSDVKGMSVSDIGKLRMMGKFKAHDTIATSDENIFIRKGIGSLIFSSDNDKFGGSLDALPDEEGYYDGGSGLSILTDTSKNWDADSLVGRKITKTEHGSTGIVYKNTATKIWVSMDYGWDRWMSGNHYTISSATQEQNPEDYLLVAGVNGNINIYEKTSQSWYVITSDISLSSPLDVGGWVRHPDAHQGLSWDADNERWFIAGRPYSHTASQYNGIWVYAEDGTQITSGDPHTISNHQIIGTGPSERRYNSLQHYGDHIYQLIYDYGPTPSVGWNNTSHGWCTRNYIRRFDKTTFALDTSGWYDDSYTDGETLISGEAVIALPHGYAQDTSTGVVDNLNGTPSVHRGMCEDLLRRKYKGTEMWWVCSSSGRSDVARGGWIALYNDDFSPYTEGGAHVYFELPPPPNYPEGATTPMLPFYYPRWDGINQWYSSVQSTVWMPDIDNDKCNYILCTLHASYKEFNPMDWNTNVPPSTWPDPSQGACPLIIYRWDENGTTIDDRSPTGTVNTFDGEFIYVRRDEYGASRELGQGLTKYIKDDVLQVAGITDTGQPNDGAMVRFFEYQVQPSLHTSDGNVVLSDGLFNAGAVNKWFGHVNTKVMAEDTTWGVREQTLMSVDEWISDDQELRPPTPQVTGIVADMQLDNLSWILNPYNSISMYTINGFPRASVGNADANGSLSEEELFSQPKYAGVGILSVIFDNSPAGTWTSGEVDGDIDHYHFYATYVYEGGQESAISAIETSWNKPGFAGVDEPDGWTDGDGLGTDQRLVGKFSLNAMGPLVNKRIKGINIYYHINYPTENDYFLLMRTDLVKGVQISGDGDDWIEWKKGEYGYIYFEIDIKDPPEIETYFSINGYRAKEDVSARFQSAVLANRMAYAGNVEFNGVIYGDTMLKSPVNKFDVFPSDRRIDVSIRDGDSIVKLETYADRILQFKKKKMHLINISQDVEFLEDTFLYKGISNQAASCNTDYGIAWVNEFGVYLYDGKEVKNLTERKELPLINPETWAAFVKDPIIGYSPKTRQLIVGDDVSTDGSGNIYVCNLITGSWTRGVANMDSTVKTAMMVDWDGDLIYVHTLGDVAAWDNTPQTQDMSVRFKDVDFGLPSQRKKVYKVHVTYKSGATVPLMTYGIDGDAAPGLAFESGSFATSRSVWTRATFKPYTAFANNCYSFRVQIQGAAVSKEFEINDISIVYRVKGIK